ncbi:MAG: CapA family protein [Bacteroidales bacterium]|nr:CapA family protein [Bacteroidales bacterium]
MKISSGLTATLLLFVNFLSVAVSPDPYLTCSDSLPDTSAVQRKIVITGVGDIMFGTSFPSRRYLPPHDNPLLLIETLIDTLSESDITFGNLEGAFLDEGEAVKKCRDTTICYLFRMPEKYVVALAAAGFDILSLANNHFGDFGLPARSRTMQLLDSSGISYGGLTEYPWAIVKKDTLLYGFCAFAPNAGTVSINDTIKAAEIVKYLSDTCDIVIVSFHGGAEGADFQRVPKADEIFHGEIRGNVHSFAHCMIDNGADVVFGHGPHVTRAVEVYNERFISYSLGNFCTYGRFNLSGPNGIAPIIKVNTDTSGRFLSGRIIPVYQRWEGGVRIDPNRRVIAKIKDLMALDFPDAVITISDNGDISYK